MWISLHPATARFTTDPSSYLNAYRDWVSDDVKNQVVLPYVSMHASTRIMVDYFVDALIIQGHHSEAL